MSRLRRPRPSRRSGRMILPMRRNSCSSASMPGFLLFFVSSYPLQYRRGGLLGAGIELGHQDRGLVALNEFLGAREELRLFLFVVVFVVFFVLFVLFLFFSFFVWVVFV